MELSNKLYTSRVLKRMSQRDVAEELEISATMVSNYEKGKCNPSKDIFIKICKLYNYDEKYKNKILEKLREHISLENMTSEEKEKRKLQQMKRASKKYYYKNKGRK